MMNTFTNLLSSLIVAVSLAAIAILSVQNATLISLRFLTFQSIQLPLGVVLAFSAGVGVLGGAIVPLVAQSSSSQQSLEDDEEDF